MNKKVLFSALCAIFFQIVFHPIYAIKAYPYPITITQPDGTYLTILLKGDESHHFRTTEDGYLLKNNTSGYLTYAYLNTNGELIESDIIARDIDKRSASDLQFLLTVTKAHGFKKSLQNSRMFSSSSLPKRAYPLTGSPKSLVILVNFSDKSYITTTPQVAFTNLLNQDNYSTNGGTGSARDYFIASSYGKFAPTFDVVGPYTLPNNMAYYGGNDTSGNDKDPQQMVIDACTAANNAGLDFIQYDTDLDGYVDNVFVYYAGFNEAEDQSANSINASTIWPHRWSLANTSTKFDGKIVYDYSCTSELKGYTGANMCGIGTFCHEFGHVLGLPDFYDTSGNQVNTLDYWEIMDAGAYNNGGRTPPTYSAYERFFLNYLTPQQVSVASNLTLLPIYQGKTQPANTANQSYLFSETTHNLVASNPTPKEFFMVEYRKKIGWDLYLPGEGMCIWHIDYDQTAWDNNEPNNYTGSIQTPTSHMRLYLQPLSGSTTTPGAAFTTGSFTPTTWSGTNINRPITDITKTTNNITFKLMGGDLVPIISTIGSITAFSTIVGTPSATQSITVTGSSLTGNLHIGLLYNPHFDIKLYSDVSWSKSLSISPTSGSVSAIVQARYNPSSVGTQTDQLVFTSNGATGTSFNVSGTATAPYDPNATAIIIGKIDNLIKFPNTKLNTTSTKTLNIKTTDIVTNLSVIISGSDAGLFNVSTSTITKDAANATSGTTLSINYLPTSLGSHTATITISGGGLNPDKVIILNGESF